MRKPKVVYTYSEKDEKILDEIFGCIVEYSILLTEYLDNTNLTPNEKKLAYHRDKGRNELLKAHSDAKSRMLPEIKVILEEDCKEIVMELMIALMMAYKVDTYQPQVKQLDPRVERIIALDLSNKPPLIKARSKVKK